MAKNQTTRQTEARNWTLIVYPDSAPTNWEQILNDKQIKWACSPLHDKDIDESAEGGAKVKKAHYHVLLSFDGKKSYSQILDITKELNTVHPQVAHSAVGTIRYFTHRDNPDKYQYNPAEIRAFGGFDIDKYNEMTASQKKATCTEILNFLVLNRVTEYVDLFVTAYQEDKQDWLDVMMQTNYAQTIKMMLASIRHTKHVPVNVMTGELVKTAVDDDKWNEEEGEG